MYLLYSEYWSVQPIETNTVYDIGEHNNYAGMALGCLVAGLWYEQYLYGLSYC